MMIWFNLSSQTVMLHAERSKLLHRNSHVVPLPKCFLVPQLCDCRCFEVMGCPQWCFLLRVLPHECSICLEVPPSDVQLCLCWVLTMNLCKLVWSRRGICQRVGVVTCRSAAVRKWSTWSFVLRALGVLTAQLQGWSETWCHSEFCQTARLWCSSTRTEIIPPQMPILWTGKVLITVKMYWFPFLAASVVCAYGI